MTRVSRLTSPRDFRRAYAVGRRGTATSVSVVLARRDDDTDPPRVGVTTNRKVGNAVRRNRAKRLLREATRHVLDGIPAGTDVVLVARAGADGRSCQEIEEDVRNALWKVGVQC